MLQQPTKEKLHALRLHGMIEAIERQEQDEEARGLSFLERLALLIDQQWNWRENQALTRRDFSCRAFLWQDGTMTELNSLVHDPNAPFLENGNSINSLGQIAGKTTVQGTPIADAFLATPSFDEVTHGTAASVAAGERPRGVSPEKVRKMLRQRMGSRYQIPFLGSPPRH